MKTIQPQNLTAYFLGTTLLVMAILALLLLPVAQQVLEQLNHFLTDGIGAIKSGMNRSYGFQ